MYIMNNSLYIFALTLTLTWTFSYSEDAPDGPDNGFGSDYSWSKSLDEGLIEAHERRAPVMVIIHKSWCGACKALKPIFAESKPLLALSENFVMINLMDGDEPKDDIYKPDGGYIPRILFLTPNGKVMTDVYNEMGSSQHKYFYSRIDDILLSMRNVLKRLKEQDTDDDDDDDEKDEL